MSSESTVTNVYKPRRVIDNESRSIIASVYNFLKKEYEFTKSFKERNCDITHLRNIARRTAEATGISVTTVERIIRNEKELMSSKTSNKTPSQILNNVNSQAQNMIAGIYNFLRSEYEYSQSIVEQNCDLSHLANIPQRTAEAANVPIETVDKIIKLIKEVPSNSEKYINSVMKSKKHVTDVQTSADQSDLFQESFQTSNPDDMYLRSRAQQEVNDEDHIKYKLPVIMEVRSTPIVQPSNSQSKVLLPNIKQMVPTNNLIPVLITKRLDGGYVNCRCCLSLGQHTRVLGQMEINMFRNDLNMFLNPDLNLPWYICTNCSTSLNIAHSFREKVLSSEAVLNNILTQQIPAHKKDPLSTSTSNLVTIKVEGVDEDDDYFIPNEIEDFTKVPSIEPPLDLDPDKLKKEKQLVLEDPLSQVKKSQEITEVVKTEKVQEARDSSSSVSKSLLTTVESSKSSGKEVRYIQVGGKFEIETAANKIRANIATLLQSCSAIPFRTKANAFLCLYCDNQYGLFQKLKEHIEGDHKNDINEHKTFESLKKTYRTIINAETSKLECKKCAKNLTDIEDLVQHMTKTHNVKLHDIDTESQVSSHGVMSYKLDTDELTCHICDKQFRFIKFLINHMTTHYGMYSCKECSKRFTKKDRLIVHSKTHIKNETKCTECSIVFNTLLQMQTHRYVKHIKKKDKKNESKCPECDKTFPLTRPFLRHLHMEEVHNVKRPTYICEVCNKSYNTIYGLNAHKRNKHAKKKHVCDVCGYVCTERTTMNRHLDHHKGIRNFECDICHKKLRTKGNLRLHLRGHYNDKRFACSLCDAAYIQKHCLTSHMKSRHPES